MMLIVEQMSILYILVSLHFASRHYVNAASDLSGDISEMHRNKCFNNSFQTVSFSYTFRDAMSCLLSPSSNLWDPHLATRGCVTLFERTPPMSPGWTAWSINLFRLSWIVLSFLVWLTWLNCFTLLLVVEYNPNHRGTTKPQQRWKPFE